MCELERGSTSRGYMVEWGSNIVYYCVVVKFHCSSLECCLRSNKGGGGRFELALEQGKTLLTGLLFRTTLMPLRKFRIRLLSSASGSDERSLCAPPPLSTSNSAEFQAATCYVRGEHTRDSPERAAHTNKALLLML